MKTRLRLLFLSCWLSCCTLPAVIASGQELPVPGSELPRPIQNGVRWLHYALLAPLQRAASEAEPASPEIRELEAIRERRGSVFRGTFMEGNQDQERASFQQAMARREAEREHQPPPQVIEWPAQPVTNDPVLSATEQLRASARNLDSLAADCEDAGQYAAADRLRKSAQRLRRDARELGQSSPAQAPDVR